MHAAVISGARPSRLTRIPRLAGLPRQILLGGACCIFFLQHDSAAVAQKLKPHRATIVEALDVPYPVASVTLGGFLPGEEVTVPVTLHNTTNRPLRFDRVEGTCSCTRYDPESATVAPGMGMVFNLTISLAARPPRASGGGILYFRNKGNIEFSLKYSYTHPDYIGLAAHLVVVTFPTGSTREEFMVPVALGDHVTEADIELQIERLDADLKYRLDREHSRITGTIQAENVVDMQRSYGALVLLNTRSGIRQSVPLILERESIVSLHPSFLTFTRKAEGEKLATVFYVKHSVEKTDGGAAQNPPAMSVAVSYDSQSLDVQRIPRGAGISQCIVRFPEKLVEVLVADGGRVDDQLLRVDVTYGTERIVRDVRFRVME